MKYDNTCVGRQTRIIRFSSELFTQLQGALKATLSWPPPTQGTPSGSFIFNCRRLVCCRGSKSSMRTDVWLIYRMNTRPVFGLFLGHRSSEDLFGTLNGSGDCVECENEGRTGWIVESPFHPADANIYPGTVACFRVVTGSKSITLDYGLDVSALEMRKVNKAL